MIELYKYINESILSDIDDTISKGDEDINKYLIAKWLNENNDFVSMFANRVSSFTASSKMRINSKNEIDVYEFRPINVFSDNDKYKLDLPVPEYIKFNSANSFILNGYNIDKLNMKLLPHFNYCGTMFIMSMRNKEKLNLAQLDIDEINSLNINIEHVRPLSWPKSKITNTFLHAIGTNDYSIDTLKSYNLDYNINNLKGLHTNTLIIPDFLVTNIANKFNYGNEFIIDGNNNDAYEWESLNKIFETKSFKNLYVYDATHAIDYCYAIKKKGDSYIIYARRCDVNNMIY